MCPPALEASQLPRTLGGKSLRSLPAYPFPAGPGGTRISLPPSGKKRRFPSPRLNSTRPKPKRGVRMKPSPRSSRQAAAWSLLAASARRRLGSRGKRSGNISIYSANTFQPLPAAATELVAAIETDAGTAGRRRAAHA